MFFTKQGIEALHGEIHRCLDIVMDVAASAPPEVLTKEVPGFGHLSVREQLTHIFSTEAAWVSRLQLLPIDRMDPARLGTVEDLRESKLHVMARTAAYLDRISEHQFNSVIESCPADWVGPQRAPSFILLHVITHGFHHKGQIATMLRLLGYPAPDTDMQR